MIRVRRIVSRASYSFAIQKMGESLSKLDSNASAQVTAGELTARSHPALQSSQELATLTSRFFHDLNNRLLVIQFAIEKLIQGLSSDDLTYTTLLTIEEASQHAADLTLQFRNAQKELLAQ